VCGAEHYHEPCANDRVRLDPYDPSTFRHAGQCEHRDASDPALLRVILKVRDGVSGGYWVGGMRHLRTRLAGSALPPAPPDLIIPAPEGGPIRRTNFRRRFWAPAVEAAGISPRRRSTICDTRQRRWLSLRAHTRKRYKLASATHRSRRR
jgi:hypothetical protein